MDYVALKHTHLMFVILSIALFYTRAFSRLASGELASKKGVKIASHGIDTLLLITAVALAVTAGFKPGQHPWLMEKLTLVFVYIGLGFVVAKSIKKQTKVMAMAVATVLLLTIGYIATSKNAVLFSFM